MSGTTPSSGPGPGDNNETNPYAQPGSSNPAAGQPWAGGPPPSSPPAWSGPTGGDPAYGQPGAKPEPPQTIMNAVRLMYVGMAMSLLGLLFTFASTDQIREAVEDADTGLSASEVDAAVNTAIGVAIFVGLLGVGLWLLMAIKNKQGRSWARVVATILGGLNIVFTLFSLTSGGTGLNLVINLITITLAAVILWFLYRPESSEYYAAVSRMNS